MKKGIRIVKLFLIGAVGYGAIELLWRGYTHWTMLLTGGVCFTALYQINDRLKNAAWWKKCALGSVVITVVEFIVGCIVNLWLKMNVWNYSNMYLNLCGQVCALYSLLWFALCIPVMKISGRIKTYYAKKDGLLGLFKK